MSEVTLAELAPGESGMVVGIKGRGMLAQRLGSIPESQPGSFEGRPWEIPLRLTPRVHSSTCAMRKLIS